MSSIAPPKFEWHDLPCTSYTGNRAFSIFVDACETDQEKQVPELGLTWAQSPAWVKKVERVSSALEGYVLRMTQKAGRGRLFFYGKVLSEEERSTPYLIEYERRMQYWPTVLLKLWFEKLTDDNGNVSYRDHAKYRDGQTYPTTVRIKHYLSDVQWGKGRFSRLYPLTDSIRWNFPTNQGSFPECLHPDVSFPAISSEPTREVVFAAGTTETEVGSDFVREHFEATPMTDWGKYEAEVVKTQVLGQYAYTVVELLPPIDDREAAT